MASKDDKRAPGVVDIHGAVANNEEAQIKRYVDGGGDLNARDGNNLTPLHIASAGGFSSAVEFLIKHNAG